MSQYWLPVNFTRGAVGCGMVFERAMGLAVGRMVTGNKDAD